MDEAKHQYCSKQQKNELVEMVVNDCDLLSGKLTNTFTFKQAQKRWEAIATKLNAIPGGQKDWKQWRKTWQDIKSRTKTKKAAMIRHSQGTGGGPVHVDTITPTEEKVLTIINPTSIVGDALVKEGKIEFIYGEEEFGAEEDQPEATDNNIDDEIMEVQEQRTPANKSQPKRSVAANRLLTSATATTALADLSKDRLAFEKEKFLFEKQYKEIKLQIIERQAKAIEDLARSFRNNQ
ncbi:hypothetical protein FQR65_LT09062 [Abscondita terminalis]|nr:hypothetical protein FQR65_LT17690 [Abscondita terminalis]KAF5300899.1 hypothetical protein FQR65_LT09062 [Abscondita terminalis]